MSARLVPTPAFFFLLSKHSFFVSFPHVPVQIETIAAFQGATIGEEGGKEGVVGRGEGREDGREDGKEEEKENRLK